MEKKILYKKIRELKKEQRAVILAHNYQIPDIQDIADFIGDSLELAKKAVKTDAKNIIMCGVDFMAESAQILNPKKKVVIPDKDAKCPMAGMVDIQGLQALKEEHPGAEVVSYINTTAEIKAVSDICCTSANAVNVVKTTNSKKVIFVPDHNLGLYVQRFVKNKELIIWPGICPTHHRIQKKEILTLKNMHPAAEILVHPECRPEVIDIADHAFSTNGMLQYSLDSQSQEFIIGTEKEMCYRLQKENPKKTFYPVESAICPNMKKITLEKVYKSLGSLEPEVKLSPRIIKNASIPLERMMAINRGN